MPLPFNAIPYYSFAEHRVVSSGGHRQGERGRGRVRAPGHRRGREQALIQVLAEGVHFGTYKFGRYLTSEDHKRPMALKRFGVFLDAKGKKTSAMQTKAFTAAMTRGPREVCALARWRKVRRRPGWTSGPGSTTKIYAFDKTHQPPPVHFMACEAALARIATEQ